MKNNFFLKGKVDAVRKVQVRVSQEAMDTFTLLSAEQAGTIVDNSYSYSCVTKTFV